jgi:hypothetical protein
MPEVARASADMLFGHFSQRGPLPAISRRSFTDPSVHASGRGAELPRHSADGPDELFDLLLLVHHIAGGERVGDAMRHVIA